jgi:large subunit ribosomal protein L14e
LIFLQALVDRPDEIRRTINFKRLVITDFKVDIPRLAKKSVLKKALEDADVFGKFAASNWGKKIAKREAKASLNDFERHAAAVKKMKRSAKVRSAFNKLKKSA